MSTSSQFVALPSGSSTFVDGTVPSNRVLQFGGHRAASDSLSSFSGSTRDSHVGFVAFNRGTFWEVSFRSGQLNPQHTGTNQAPVDAIQPILDALGAATGMPVVRAAS